MATITVGHERNITNPHSMTFEEREKQLERLEMQREAERKQAQNSPYSTWAQYNLEHTREMMTLALKHPKAHAILYFLVDQMDNFNAVVCSYKTLQELLGIGHATVARSVRILKDLGFIAVLKSGTSNVYTVNDSVYWKSWGTNKRYSKFPSNIILSMSEQDKDIQLSFDDLGYTMHKEVTKKVNPKA